MSFGVGDRLGVARCRLEVSQFGHKLVDLAANARTQKKSRIGQRGAHQTLDIIVDFSAFFAKRTPVKNLTFFLPVSCLFVVVVAAPSCVGM
ncbi:MAG: hypothetical protein AAGJ35_09795 [Myxococcota bacterium]